MNEKNYYWDSHSLMVSDDVYYPMEDSELLMQSVQFQKNAFVLDLGCGSGIQGFNALHHGAKKVLAVDVNERAIDCAANNAKLLGLDSTRWSCRQSDLFSAVSESFDCIVFNPPYLPEENPKNLSLDGGKIGRELLDRFLKTFSEHLNENGIAYFLQSSLNKIEETERLLQHQKIRFEIIARKKLFFEELTVWKAWG